MCGMTDVPFLDTRHAVLILWKWHPGPDKIYAVTNENYGSWKVNSAVTNENYEVDITRWTISPVCSKRKRKQCWKAYNRRWLRSTIVLHIRIKTVSKTITIGMCFVGSKVEPWCNFRGWHVKGSDIPKRYFFDIKNCNVYAGTVMAFDGDCLQRYWSRCQW